MSGKCWPVDCIPRMFGAFTNIWKDVSGWRFVFIAINAQGQSKEATTIADQTRLFQTSTASSVTLLRRNTFDVP